MKRSFWPPKEEHEKRDWDWDTWLEQTFKSICATSRQSPNARFPQMAASSHSTCAVLSFTPSFYLIEFCSQSIRPFFSPARAAGNKLTESKWGSEEDKVFTICGIYCSPRSCGRLIRVELLECRFPFWNNVFHAYNRRKNYSSKWMPSNLVANNPARWYDLSS